MSSAEPLRRLNELLAQALELPPAARTHWLQSLPPEQHALVPQLRALLERAGVETDSFMRRPAAHALDAAAALESRPDQSGDLIGPWRLREELGRGGMSTVWLAERADGALVRQVALKLPRLGWSEGLVQRMARERDLLAALEHPHIARLYDAGLTAAGRPWLAMERVTGEPIDIHCRDHALTLEQIVQLALQVCEALAHAHARLIVHRDLKPANILVTPAGDVRLLDFGIGKLLQEEATDEAAGAGAAGTALTQALGRVLTPDYASPEQVAGHTVTVATDVYSLGVVLYELLAGERPYRLARQSMAALEEAILAADVPRASARAADKSRARALRGDLDAVLAKALAKNPARRYSSIEALAADLQAFLEGRPVAAQPQRTRYRAAKYLRRNAWPVAMGGAVVLSLVVGLGAALWQARAARQQALRAEEARQFIAGLLREAQPRQGALNAGVGGGSVGGGGGGAVRTADLLVRAAERIETELADDAVLAAELGVMIGEQLSALGEKQLGEAALRAAVARAEHALGRRHPLTVHGRALLAESLAVQHPQEAHRIADALVPDALAGLPATASDAVLALRMQSFQLAKLNQAEPSIRVLQQAVAVAQQYLGAEHEQTLITLGLLSNTHGRFRQFERQLAVASDAMSLAQSALGAARPHVTLTEVERWYGEALRRNGRPADAVRILRQVVQDQRGLDGAETPRVRNAVFQLGLALGEMGRLGEGITLLRQVVAMEAQHNQVLNEDRIAFRGALWALLGFARRSDEVDAADAELEALRQALGGPAASATTSAGSVIGALRGARFLAQRGLFAQALEQAEGGLARIEALQPPEPALRTEAWTVLALIARLQGRHELARQRAERGWNDASRAQARPATQAALAAELAAASLELGDAVRAQALNREALVLFAQAQVVASPHSTEAWITEARLHLRSGRSAQALAALEPLVAAWAEAHSGSAWHAQALHWRALAWAQMGRTAAAAADRAAAWPLLRESRIPALRRLAGAA